MAGTPRPKSAWTKDVILRYIEGWCFKRDYIFSPSLKDRSEHWLRSMFLMESGRSGIGYGRELVYTGTARSYVIDDIKLMQYLTRKPHSGAMGLGQPGEGAAYLREHGNNPLKKKDKVPKPPKPPKQPKAERTPSKRNWTAQELEIIREQVPAHGLDMSCWDNERRLVGRKRREIALAALQMGIEIPENDRARYSNVLSQLEEMLGMGSAPEKREVLPPVMEDPLAGIKLQLAMYEEDGFASSQDQGLGDDVELESVAISSETPAIDRHTSLSKDESITRGDQYDADAAAALLARKYGSRVKRDSRL